STEAVAEQIGSGPFVFVADEFEPGVRTVYYRGKGYRIVGSFVSLARRGRKVVRNVKWKTAK
ncbi:MAG: ABC transporter substrate-binding protein, partial [Pseudomonadota bacterium]